MRFRTLGKTGIRVSEVGLGCGFLGWEPGFDFPRLLSQAFDLGINVYDTADFYCDYESERWLGEAFASKRDQVVLVTKFGSIPTPSGALNKDWSAEHMRRSVQESLSRLRTDYIDVYLLHTPEPDVLQNVELYEALHQLKQRGTIRAFGISLYGVDFLRKTIEKWQPDVVQIHFNLFSQSSSVVFAEAIAAGVGLIARRPLDAGMLGGGLVSGAPMKLGDPRPRWGADLTEQRQKLLEELRFLIEGTARTWAQASLQFVLSFDAISTSIPSTISISHLRENIAAAGKKLDREELQRIAELLSGEFPRINLAY